MECKKIVPSEFKKITSYSPLLLLVSLIQPLYESFYGHIRRKRRKVRNIYSILGVGCMKVENAKFEQYSRGQFLSMVNIITRYKTAYISKNISKQLVASLSCVFTGFQQVFTD